jgi:chemotaxis protein CheD
LLVDTGIKALLSAISELGAEPYRLKVYVAGGAQIMDSAGFFNIGKKNHQALLDILGKEGLRVQAEQIGGLVNRTMHLNIATGGVSLKVSGHAKDSPLCKS